jgi:hypothetical protein
MTTTAPAAPDPPLTGERDETDHALGGRGALGKAVTTEEEAIAELDGASARRSAARASYASVVGADSRRDRSGEGNREGARAEGAGADAEDAAAAEQKKQAIKARTVDTTMKAHEKKLTVPLKELLAAQLTASSRRARSSRRRRR